MSNGVYIYSRVSSKGQVDGDGLARQEEACEKFCAQKGWGVRNIFQERGVSGTVSGLARPAFAEMIDSALCWHIKTVVVERADRLARDLIESELIIRHCEENGIKVWCADSGECLNDDDCDPTRKLLRQMMSALAEWEKSVIVKKTRAARDKIRAETGRCEGRKPYDNQQIIAHIYSLRLEGAKWGYMEDYLNSQFRGEAPTAAGWNRRTIKRIFKREQERLTNA